MGRSRVLGIAALVTGVLALLAPGPGSAAGGPPARLASTADPQCTADYSGPAPAAGAAPLRFGIDPGLAGSVGGAQLPTVTDDGGKDVSFSSRLRPAGHVLVVRLNRLFWSGGEPLIDQFKALVAQYDKVGLEVELQVRYHPPSGHDGDLAAWTTYVRHVVDVFGSDPHVVAMTITNEVNVTFSPNTSDGSYTNADDALIHGIEPAHDEALKRGDRQLQFGFTYAYRSRRPGTPPSSPTWAATAGVLSKARSVSSASTSTPARSSHRRWARPTPTAATPRRRSAPSANA